MNYFRQKLKRLPVHEWAEFGFVLCFVGGFLDAYTYLTRGGVFANAQTGNMILLVIGLARGDGLGALRFLFPILMFCLGVLASQLFLYLAKKRNREFGGHGVILLAETAVLSLVGFLPAQTPDAVVNALISFVAAIQYDNFRRMEGMAIATAFCTGNLRSATEQIFNSFTKRDKKPLFFAMKYLFIILGFLGGVFGGYFTVTALDGYSTLVAAAILFGLFTVLLICERLRKKLLEPQITVRRLDEEELPAARELVLETYSKFVAPDCTEEGRERFRAFLYDERLPKQAEFFGVFDGIELQGALFVRRTHICAFFVRNGEQGKGYGGALMRGFLKQSTEKEITVYASRYGKPVYEKFGFLPTDEEQLKDGMLFTPMKLTRTDL